VFVKKLSPGGQSPLTHPENENKWKAGVLVKEYRVLNSRSRMMIKVSNAYVRDVKVKHNFMSAINVEAEMCSKWEEGVPGHDILIEDVEISDVDTAGKEGWKGAITIGSKCGHHELEHAHSNIKVGGYGFSKCASRVRGCFQGEEKFRKYGHVRNLVI